MGLHNIIKSYSPIECLRFRSTKQPKGLLRLLVERDMKRGMEKCHCLVVLEGHTNNGEERNEFLRSGLLPQNGASQVDP